MIEIRQTISASQVKTQDNVGEPQQIDMKTAKADEDRSYEEYKKERQIKSLNLSKDDMYSRLLEPYRFEKITNVDEYSGKSIIYYI